MCCLGGFIDVKSGTMPLTGTRYVSTDDGEGDMRTFFVDVTV